MRASRIDILCVRAVPFEVDWGGSLMTISLLLTNFFHHFDMPTCEKLATKAFAGCWRPAAARSRWNSSRTLIASRRRSHATFALTMLATTGHGDAYTFAEYDRVFAKAGFRRSEFHALPPTTQQAVVSYK